MKLWKSRPLLILLAVLGLFISCFFLLKPRIPDPPNTVNSIQEFETYLNELVDSGVPQGLSLAVVKDEEIVYNKGFGWADRPRKIKATGQSIYHWWSCTKIVTAIAILQLQEKNLLNINDTATQYLPFFEVSHPTDENTPVTILQLLNHSSGLSDPGLKIMKWIHHENEPPLNQTRFLKKVFPDFANLLFEPGEYTQYSNVGYMALGAIVEQASGQSYEDYVREFVLQPLQMRSTDFLYTKTMEPHEAAGGHPLIDAWTPIIPYLAGSFIREITDNHIWFKRIYTDQTAPTALLGSVEDAARLLIAYINGGELDGKRILSKESIDVMTYAGYVKAKVDDPELYRRQGLGWQVYKDGDRLMVKHEGGGLGFSTVLQLYPEEKLGFILFTNDYKCQGWRIVNLASRLKW